MGNVQRRDERASEMAQPARAPEPVAPAPMAQGPGPLTPSGVVSLQRSAGNAATSAVLHLDSPRAGGSTLALTQGSDVHFAPGAYQPGTPRRPRARATSSRTSPSSGAGRSAARSGAGRSRPTRSARPPSGRPRDVLLGAPAGIEQHYEANEHEGLGNTAGGDKITIVTKSGVRLTYGQVVALSGDFYRSPEALMNAPADELRKILAVMAHEKALVARRAGS